MEYRQGVPLPLQCTHDEPPDKTIPANEKDAHSTAESSAEGVVQTRIRLGEERSLNRRSR
jgi:hypothetical protein